MTSEINTSACEKCNGKDDVQLTEILPLYTVGGTKYKVRILNPKMICKPCLTDDEVNNTDHALAWYVKNNGTTFMDPEIPREKRTGFTVICNKCGNRQILRHPDEGGSILIQINAYQSREMAVYEINCECGETYDQFPK